MAEEAREPGRRLLPTSYLGLHTHLLQHLNTMRKDIVGEYIVSKFRLGFCTRTEESALAIQSVEITPSVLSLPLPHSLKTDHELPVVMKD
jgi:hypothetical protein